MKKLLSILLSAGIAMLIACGPSPEEKAAPFSKLKWKKRSKILLPQQIWKKQDKTPWKLLLKRNLLKRPTSRR